MEGVAFERNVARAGSGGALLGYVSRLEVAGARFRGNAAAVAGGALSTTLCQSAVRFGLGVILTDCAFLDNAADTQGGAIMLDGSDVQVPTPRASGLLGFWGFGIPTRTARPPLRSNRLGPRLRKPSSTHHRRLVMSRHHRL